MKDILEAKRIVSRGEWSSLSTGKEGLKKKKKERNKITGFGSRKENNDDLTKTFLGVEVEEEAEGNPRG